MSNVEFAKNTLETILESPSNTRGLAKAADAVIGAQDPGGLELLSVVLEMVPSAELLPPLWALAEDEGARKVARSYALQAITSVLVSCRLALERQTERNVLTADELRGQVDHLMAFYQDGTRPEDLRRRALEMAANASHRRSIVQAGEAALKQEDPLWAATGLFVCRITQPDRARELVEQALNHPSSELHYEAIAGLAELGEDQDYERLKDFIYDGTPDERSAALWALVETPDGRAGDALVEATRWLQGKAQYEAQEANDQWLERWSDSLQSGEKPAPRSNRVVISRRGLDRYLSDDFLLDDEEKWTD
jgi:hypothetical protein